MAHFTLSWTPPTTREDGTALTDEDKLTYRVFEDAQVIVDNIDATYLSVNAEDNSKHESRLMTLIAATGLESAISEPLPVNFIKPLPPTGLSVSFDG